MHILAEKNRAANHAIVFMLRGIFHQWKMPLCYYLSAGSLKGKDFAELSKHVIEKCASIGLDVRALDTDQGANYRRAHTTLGVTKETPSFVLNDKKYTVYTICPTYLKVLVILCWNLIYFRMEGESVGTMLLTPTELTVHPWR